MHRWSPRKGDYVHKTARTRRDRAIHLPPALADAVRRRMGGPDEPLFRTGRGRQWTAGNVVSRATTARTRPAFASHCAAVGIDPDGVTAYCFRHTFISDWIDSGRSIATVARLCGTSVAVIERVYGHADDEATRAAYLDFNGLR